MSILRRTGARFLKDDKGGSLFGYALLIGLVAVVLLGATSYQGGGQWRPPDLFTMPTWWKI